MFSSQSPGEIGLRKPRPEDSRAIHNLIQENPPLDANSVYSYHLLASHFYDTCVIAQSGDEVVGFLSAYVKPNEPETLFVWQVVVDSGMRGKGVARMMLSGLLSRPECKQIKVVEATVNPSNQASRRLFERYAEDWGEGISEELFMDESCFDGGHEEEILLRIPLRQAQAYLKEVK